MTTEKAIAKRIKIERAIISCLVRDGLKLGYTVSVHDGEEWALKHSKGYRAIMAAIQSTDMDTLRFRKNGVKIGDFHMVYGNDGYDVISDYSDNKLSNELITNANLLSNKYQ